MYAASSYGDPHFLTLDKLSYTFSPIGEFWLVKHDNFSLQVRMIQAWNAFGKLTPGGSVFGGVASKVPGAATVCVLMNSNRTGMGQVTLSFAFDIILVISSQDA